MISPAQFEDLYREHRAHVYRFCMSRLRNPDDAEDATEDTFFKAWKHLHTFRDECSPRTWLFTIAAHETGNYFRYRNTHRGDISLSEPLPLFNEDGDCCVPQLAVTDHALELMLAQLDLLPALRHLRRAYPVDSQYVGLWLDGLTYLEIAALLGASLAMVKDRLFKARQRMRSHIVPAHRRAR